MAELGPDRSELGAFKKSELGVRLMTPRTPPGTDFLHTVDLTQDAGNIFAFAYQWWEHGDTSLSYPAGTAATAVLFDTGGTEVARLETISAGQFSALTFFERGASHQVRPVSVPTPAGFTTHSFIRGTAPLPATLPEIGKVEIRQSSDQAIIVTYDDLMATSLIEGAEAQATYTEPDALNLVTEDGAIVCPGTGEVFSIAIQWRYEILPGPPFDVWEIAIDTGTIAAYRDVSIPGACVGPGTAFGWEFLDVLGGTISQASGTAMPTTGNPAIPRFQLAGGGEWPGQDGGLWERIRQNVGIQVTVEPVTMTLTLLGSGNFTVALAPRTLTHRP